MLMQDSSDADLESQAEYTEWFQSSKQCDMNAPSVSLIQPKYNLLNYQNLCSMEAQSTPNTAPKVLVP